MSSAAVLQDPLPTSPSTTGPRFRPFASPNHHVTKGRYITSNDPRGYIPVYEYPLNGQWIMMDIDDGYILWTGIWKALGNSKADIVKMIDSQPDLAPLIRRVRGGYLKIQGTWMPYEVALRLSRRVAWTIRDDLIPLFGPTFPSTCLSPDQPGYGQVVASGPNGRRRARRNTQGNPNAAQLPREPQTNWTVMTPVDPGTSRLPQPQPPLSPRSRSAYYSNYRDPGHYHDYQQHQQQQQQQAALTLRPVRDVDPGSPATTASRSSVRYSPYSAHASSHHHPTRHLSPPENNRTHLSLDIPSLSLRESTHSPSLPLIDAQEAEHITLPPIKAHDSCHSRSPYALPPISAMEDLRGVNVNDSAAVLRRLKSDDDSSPPLEHNRHIDAGYRRPSFSKTHRSSDSKIDRRPTQSPYDSAAARSYYQHQHQQDHYYSHHPSRRSPTSSSESDSDHPQHSHYYYSPPLSLSVPSDGISTCDPSPISPATPRSTSSGREYHGIHLPPPLVTAAQQGRGGSGGGGGHGRKTSEMGPGMMGDCPSSRGHSHHISRNSDERQLDGSLEVLGSRRHSDASSGEGHSRRPW